MNTNFIKVKEKEKAMLEFINVDSYKTLIWDVNLTTGTVSGTGYGYIRERGSFDSKTISPGHALNEISNIEERIKGRENITIIADRSPDTGGFDYTII